MNNIIESQLQIPELYLLRNKHNSNPNEGFNYVDNLTKNCVQSMLFDNAVMEKFLDYINQMVNVMIGSVSKVRNFMYFTHGKNYNGQGY